MDSRNLDIIVSSFVSAIQSGFIALQGYALPLLAALSLLTFYLEVGSRIGMGIQLGESLAGTLLIVLKIGVFMWLVSNIYPLAMALFNSFLTWGLAVSHGTFSAEDFLHPSRFLDMGFRAAFPVQKLLQSFTGITALWNFHTILGYMFTYWVIVFAFAAMVLHMIVTIIEFHLAVMFLPVLLPWGIFVHTAFFAEFGIGWFTDALVRVMVSGAMLGIAVPLFETLSINLTAGGDPTFYSSVVMALASLIFCILAWIVPGRAAAIAGRGMTLALQGSDLLRGAASSARSVLTVTAAVRGVSTMVQGQRR